MNSFIYFLNENFVVKVNVNILNWEGVVLIYWVVCINDVGVLVFLLESGVDINFVDRIGLMFFINVVRYI